MANTVRKRVKQPRSAQYRIITRIYGHEKRRYYPQVKILGFLWIGVGVRLFIEPWNFSCYTWNAEAATHKEAADAILRHRSEAVLYEVIIETKKEAE